MRYLCSYIRHNASIMAMSIICPPEGPLDAHCVRVRVCVSHHHNNWPARRDLSPRENHPVPWLPAPLTGQTTWPLSQSGCSQWRTTMTASWHSSPRHERHQPPKRHASLAGVWGSEVPAHHETPPPRGRLPRPPLQTGGGLKGRSCRTATSYSVGPLDEPSPTALPYSAGATLPRLQRSAMPLTLPAMGSS